MLSFAFNNNGKTIQVKTLFWLSFKLRYTATLEPKKRREEKKMNANALECFLFDIDNIMDIRMQTISNIWMEILCKGCSISFMIFLDIFILCDIKESTTQRIMFHFEGTEKKGENRRIKMRFHFHIVQHIPHSKLFTSQKILFSVSISCV